MDRGRTVKLSRGGFSIPQEENFVVIIQSIPWICKYLASFEELEAAEAGIWEEASSKILADENPNLLTLVMSESLSE